MRLPSIEKGGPQVHALDVRMQQERGRRLPDIVRVFLFRAEPFGEPFGRYVDRVLRGPSEWTTGERELFGAFVSARNVCRFCTTIHAAIAVEGMLGIDVNALLADWRTQDLSPRLRAALQFLDVLTLVPAKVSPESVRVLRECGVRDAGIEDLVHIATIFCTINRVADALGFLVPSPQEMARDAPRLLAQGY